MRLKILFALLVLMTAVSTATAQYPNNYTAYQTMSVDPTTHNLTVMITISGTTLPPVPNMPGYTHQAQANVGFNGNITWAYGPQVCTSCNVNWTNGWELDSSDPCFPLSCTLESSEFVHCSGIGTFWSSGSITFLVEEAVTYSKVTGGAPPIFTLTNWCTTSTTPPALGPDSSPPDWAPTIMHGNAYWSYYVSLSVCSRSKSAPPGSPWNCQPNPTTINHGSNTSDPRVCTNHDKGTSGTWF
jgi:hypothetical protein